jgi:ribosome-associated toxin RatA of RatAB toxin-antitoxin module
MWRVILTVVVFAVVSLFVLPAVADFFQVRTALDEPGVDQQTLAKLMTNGQLLFVRENSAGRLQLITGGILINKPPAAVWQTVIDYPNYPKFMPSTAECRVVADSGNVKDIRYKIKFKFLIFSFTVSYVVRTWFRPIEEMTFNLISSEDNKISKSYGSWRFISVNGGKQTAVFYSVYSDITNVVPGLGSFLRKDPTMETAINASTVLLVIKAVKNRSENPNWVQQQ